MKIAQKVAILCLLVSNVCFSKEGFRLMLAGGGLSTCSSVASKNCRGGDIFHEGRAFRQSLLFALNDAAITQATSASLWPETREQQRQDWERLIRELQQNYPEQKFTRDQFQHLLRNSGIEVDGRHISGDELYRGASDAELYRILDHLEIPQFGKDGKRLKEQVSLADNRSPYSVEIYRQFVAMSGEAGNTAKPHILVITASSRDPFEAVDFYTSVFQQSGAAEVTWLPLDAAFQQAQWLRTQDPQACQRLPAYRAELNGNHNREAIYPDLVAKQRQMCEKPELLREMLVAADGIFLNGGDQSLTARAFRFPDGSDTEELKLIRERFLAGKLAIGGTSAGTAVLSGKHGGRHSPRHPGMTNAPSPAMITNGSSRTALERGAFEGWAPPAYCSKDDSCGHNRLEDDLTYRPEGGLQLFPWGIADTHFSERARHPRLALLARQTGSRFGFGVDENTALLLTPDPDQTHMQVIGEGGVVILDTGNTELKRWSGGHRLKQIGMHFLTRGDRLKIDTEGRLSVQFAGWKRPITPQPADLGRPDQVLEGDTLRKLTQLLCLSEQDEITAMAGWRNDYRVTLAKPENSQQVYGVARVGQGEAAQTWKYCSFAGWTLSLRPD